MDAPEITEEMWHREMQRLNGLHPSQMAAEKFHIYGDFPMSCGCKMTNSDTAGSSLGIVRCKHGRTIFCPSTQGVQLESQQLKERRTHLL